MNLLTRRFPHRPRQNPALIRAVGMGEQIVGYNFDAETDLWLHTAELVGCTAVGVTASLPESRLSVGLLAHINPGNADFQLPQLCENLETLREAGSVITQSVVLTAKRPGEKCPKYDWVETIRAALGTLESLHGPQLTLYDAPGRSRAMDVQLGVDASALYIDDRLIKPSRT